MKLVVKNLGLIYVYEDIYNEGLGDFVNQWEFDVRGTYDSAEKLIERIQNATGMFFDHNSNDFFVDEPGRLLASEFVNFENDKASQDEIERWKKGEIKLYTADMYLEVDVAGGIREIEWSDADEFGFGKA